MAKLYGMRYGAQDSPMHLLAVYCCIGAHTCEGVDQREPSHATQSQSPGKPIHTHTWTIKAPQLVYTTHNSRKKERRN